jgi:hypothetical protein
MSFVILCFVYRAFYRKSKSNQQIDKIIGKYNIYYQPLHVCRQKDSIFRGYISDRYISPEDGNLLAETYVGVENISYTYQQSCADVICFVREQMQSVTKTRNCGIL